MLAWISVFHECVVDRIAYTNEWDCNSEIPILPDPLSSSAASLPRLRSRYAQEQRDRVWEADYIRLDVVSLIYVLF